MTHRTKTYIAGDWTGDADLIQQLYKWNEGDRWALHFLDAHEMTQARDTSLCCSIKHSLLERLKASKKFVLLVGNQTDSLTKGGCRYCDSYSSLTHSCRKGHSCSHESYVQYECRMADLYRMQIIVIYNYACVKKSKCPQILRYKGNHVNGIYRDPSGKYYWNYAEIKQTIMEG